MKAFIVDRYGKKDGARIGSRVRLFKPGDEVYARPDKDRIGTLAEIHHDE